MEDQLALPKQHWYPNSERWYGVTYVLDDSWTLKKYIDMLIWIQERIENPLRHARWRIVDDVVEVRFRYERDYLMFCLSW